MGRRTVLLIVAVLIAALGSTMVFLYVRGADNRAQAAQSPVQVLKAVATIAPGETIEQAQAAGKIQLGTVPRAQVLDGAVSSTEMLARKVALSAIYPNEQIISAKFGSPGDQKVLTIPKGEVAISVSLNDTGRVAGFISPGAEVAIFLTATPVAPDGEDAATAAAGYTRLLLPRVKVIAVGSTTVISRTTTTAEGAQTTEQLPRTLFTLAVDQAEAERILYASTHGELAFALLSEASKVRPGPGMTEQDLFQES